MSPPLVSVLLPVYNARRHLAAAVESLLSQSHRELQILAIDDGSSDGSLDLLQDFARRDSRLSVISRPNTGIVGALNDALALASGEFAARMDADDIARPERISLQVAHLQAHPDCVAVGSAVVLLDPAGNPVRRMPRPLTGPENAAAALAGDGGTLIHPSVTFRTAAVRQVGGYRRFAQNVEDLDLYLRLARIGTLENLPDFLLGYRVHPQSVNFTRQAGRRTLLLRVLAEAHAERNLPFDPASIPDLPARWSDPVAHHRDWAVTALELGPRRIAIGHGLLACWHRPLDRASWRALAYALRAPRRPLPSPFAPARGNPP